MRLRTKTSSEEADGHLLRFLEEYPCPFVTYTGIKNCCGIHIFILPALKTNELLKIISSLHTLLL